MPSTVIAGFDYDEAMRTLTVRFQTGRVYRYIDVPPEEAEAMGTAFSKGSYFNRRIRDHFDFLRLA